MSGCLQKLIRKLRAAAGLPCQECGGRGYVVDSNVAKFIERNGLAAFQSATALMVNEDIYGGLGSLPVSAWEELGMTEDAAMDFCTETGHVHVLHCCRSCNGQPNHSDPLGSAMKVLNGYVEERRRKRNEYASQWTPEDWRRGRFQRMASAIRCAQIPQDFEDFVDDTPECWP